MSRALPSFTHELRGEDFGIDREGAEFSDAELSLIEARAISAEHAR